VINLIQSATTLQFILGSVAFVAGVMILLQLIVRKSVWTPYVLTFSGSLIFLAVTLR
jgi:hypothetical protein